MFDSIQARLYRQLAVMNTAEDVRTIFKERGVSLSYWARRHGFSESLVYQVLSGKRRACRGESHRIAVALGLKVDKAVSCQDIDRQLIADKEEIK